jgi:hypothetical protein
MNRFAPISCSLRNYAGKRFDPAQKRSMSYPENESLNDIVLVWSGLKANDLAHMTFADPDEVVSPPSEYKRDALRNRRIPDCLPPNKLSD